MVDMASNKRKRYPELAVDSNTGQTKDAASIKRFQCDFEGCRKTYSRAEHLARHQLNHSPREIFRCEFPGCDRWFVRQDLCTRHYERHFQDRDRGLGAPTSDSARTPTSPNRGSADHHPLSDSTRKRRVGRPKLADMRPPTPPPTTSTIDRTSPGEFNDSRMNPSMFNGARYQPTSTSVPVPQLASESSGVGIDCGDPQSNGSGFDAHNLVNSSMTTGRINTLHHSNPRSDDLPLSAAEQPSSFGVQPAGIPQHGPRSRRDTRDSSNPAAFPINPSAPVNSRSMLGATTTPGLLPNFYDHFSESPGSTRNDEFTSWLFDDLQNFYSGIGPIGLQTHVGFPDNADSLYEVQFPDAADNFSVPSFARQDSQWQPNSDSHFLGMGEQSWLSETRWRHLIEFIKLFFNESTTSRGHFNRDAIFSGDLEAEDHVLSLKLLNAYIASYWQSYHEQMPILHKPTFFTDEVPELLLLAVMMIGAAHIPTRMGPSIKDNAHNFATFVAWHLRWHIFMHDDFHPPAKLWIFQTLILLEVFEKMKATRFLHERAALHNATTISLIRRGTALVDSSAVPDMAGGGMAPMEWWDRWVRAEATRRAAFAAFLMDASHASLFGHSNVMGAHEIQLPLPCDDALWSATSPSEVGRVEASLYANNVRPLTFLHGLKRMLSGRKVRTNAFGRIVLLAGLQSVSWHMRQREKVSNLGKGLGAPEVWRQTLTRAFDFWKQDFDEDFSQRQRAFMAWQNSGAVADSRTMAEYASVMHHLSHLAMQLDIIEAQIMAGAVRLVSRTITDADRERVSRKLSHWRDTPEADLAFKHAVQLLLAYIPEDRETGRASRYSIMDDCLTIRPWSLYYAALTAWCYIFVKQHPNEHVSAASSDSSGAMESRRASLERDAVPGRRIPTGVRATQNVNSKQTARSTAQQNANSSSSDKFLLNFGAAQLTKTLGTLARILGESRWELLREAAERLRTALDMLAATNSE